MCSPQGKAKGLNAVAKRTYNDVAVHCSYCSFCSCSEEQYRSEDTLETKLEAGIVLGFGIVLGAFLLKEFRFSINYQFYLVSLRHFFGILLMPSFDTVIISLLYFLIISDNP